MQHLHRPVSNRGQWRDTLTIYADGAPDPSTTTYAFVAWPSDVHAGASDYGQPYVGSRGLVLSARTGDETGRLAVASNGNSVTVTWLFPPNEMRGLMPGSYEGSIGAWIGGQMSEIAAFKFVVQARGGISFGGAAPLPPPFPTEDIDVTITIGDGERG
ncbi:hypothetical protein C0214_19695 [Methylobacterium sp. DM1]|nr:hypothetical protein C0214_19695 [Methylobacterium sp. DM1]